MTSTIPSSLYQKTSDLATLAYRFAETYRANRIPPSGEQPESDTDHTVMLSLIACALANQYAPELKTSKVAEYALIHYLVEAYAGDTVSVALNLNEAGRIDKIERERLALERIKHEFDDTFPWISQMIESYEEQMIPEARFVRVVDKFMPGLGHLQTDCITFKQLGLPPEAIEKNIAKQTLWIEEYGKEWPEIINLYKNIMDQVLDNPFFHQTD